MTGPLPIPLMGADGKVWVVVVPKLTEDGYDLLLGQLRVWRPYITSTGEVVAQAAPAAEEGKA